MDLEQHFSANLEKPGKASADHDTNNGFFLLKARCHEKTKVSLSCSYLKIRV